VPDPVQDYEAARKKALAVGAKKFFLDVRRSFSDVTVEDTHDVYRISKRSS
jgi:argininosuccinate synthase